jgi:hypothetical protein
MNVKLIDETTITVKEPTEEDQIGYLTMLEEYQRKAKENGEFEAQKYAIDYQNRLVGRLAGKSVEEVRKMALVDKNKIIEAVKSRMMVLGKANHNLDF